MRSVIEVTQDGRADTGVYNIAGNSTQERLSYAALLVLVYFTTNAAMLLLTKKKNGHVGHAIR